MLLGGDEGQTGEAVDEVLGGFGAAEALEFGPAGPGGIDGGVGDLAEEAFPFDEEAVDVAAVDVFGEAFQGDVFSGAEEADDFGAAGAVVDGHAVEEEAVAGETAVGFLAGVGEASGPAGFVAAEAVAGGEVGHVLHEVVEGVFFVFESGEDAEALGAGEAGHEAAAAGEEEVFIEQADAVPEPEEGGLGVEDEAFGTVEAGEAEGGGVFFAADEAGASGIGLEAAREWAGDFLGGLDAEGDEVRGEEFLSEGGGGLVKGDALGKFAQEGTPREGGAAAEVTGAGLAEAGGAFGDEDVPLFVEATATGAAEHLEEFGGGDFAGQASGGEAGGGDEDGAEGEVDAGAEAEGGDDDAELAALGEGFDESGALDVAEAAVVVGDALGEEFAEIGSGGVSLVLGEAHGLGAREAGGDVFGELFGFAAVGGEDEDGAEVFAEGTGDAAGPVASDGVGDVAGKGVDFDFVEGDGAFALLDHGDGATALEAQEPVADDGGVGDAAAEKEELGFGGEGEDGAFVVVTAEGVGEPLVFVDDVEGGVGGELLGLEGGDDEGGVGVVGEVAGGDADAPPLAGPLGEFVVGEGAGGDGVDDLAGSAALLEELLEDEGLARAGGGLDDDVVAGGEGADGLGLPGVGEAELLEGVEAGHRSIKGGMGRGVDF